MNDESNAQPSLTSLIDEAFGTAEPTTAPSQDYKSVIDKLDPDGRALVQNLRTDYTTKTAELAARARELEQREQSLLSNDVVNQLRNQMGDVPEDLDLYNPDHLQKYIEAKAASLVESILAPRVQQINQDNRKKEIDTFISNTGDFSTHRPVVIELMTNNPDLKMEDAYYLAKGRAASTEQAALAAELAAYKKAAHDAGMKVSTGSSPGRAVRPKFANAVEAYEWMSSQQK